MKPHWKVLLFDKKLVQPFKQVFRELYVKTDDELNMTYSLRYAGNSVQPKKTAACLKLRSWVADIENGLQKVYYKENITAQIYALADWFSPADIECLTIEWVAFSDRKTGKSIAIKDIPEIIFSEVMRDALELAAPNSGNAGTAILSFKMNIMILLLQGNTTVYVIYQ